MRTARNAGERQAPWIGAFLALVGPGQGGLWAFLLVRFA